MNVQTRLRYLRPVLVMAGLIFIFGVLPLMSLWPSGWRWQPNQAEYEQMIVGVYAVLGVFLLMAARNPLEHLSLVWFAAWSSLAHGAIMAVQTFVDPAERGHLLGDVPALLLVAAVLFVLTPRRSELGQTARGPGAGHEGTSPEAANPAAP